MALPFNPFDKPKPKLEDKKRFTKVKVFELADFEQEPTAISQSLDSNKPVNRQESASLASHYPLDRTAISQSLDSNKPVNFSEIIGDERHFLLFIFKHLEFQASRETLPITTDDLKITFNKKSKAISNLIERLVGKNVLIVKKSARGNASWRIFFVPEKTFTEIRDHHSISQSLASHYPLDKPVHWTGNESNSSNKSFLRLETTSIQIPIPENLKTIISQKEIKNLLEKGTLEDDLRQSLEHFSYDLEHNLVRSKTSPINLFFGLMRSSQKYKSLKLLEQENNELRKYQDELNRLEREKKELQSIQLKEKYQDFKQNNPDFLVKIKEENKFLQNEEMTDRLGYSRFVKEQQMSTTRIEREEE